MMNARFVGYFACAVLALGAAAQDAASTLDQAFQTLPAYTFGGDSTGLEAIRAEVSRVHSDAAAREALAARFAAVLDGESTPDAKLFVCRQLFVMGSVESLPVLTKLLGIPETADEARYALERMPIAEAGAALRSALEQLQGRERIGVINSLGVRGDVEAVPALAAILGQDDVDAAGAAAEALTRIGDAAACDALRAHIEDARDPVKHAAEDGVLACAETKVAAGAPAEAVALYEALYNAGRRDAVRVAAFRGLVQARQEDTAAMLKAALTGDDEPVAMAALRFVREAQDLMLTPAFAEWLPRLSAERAVQALDALADRGDAAALPAIISLVRHNAQEDIQRAALAALGAIGDRTAIPVLARAAAEGSPEIAQVAKESLTRLKGDDINRVMMTAARAGKDAIAKVLIEVLGERQATEISGDMIAKFAKSFGKPDVRLVALRALANIAEPDQLDDLVNILVLAKIGEVELEAEAQRAIVATAVRAEGPQKTAAVLAALPSADKPASRAALVGALGKIGDASGLDAIRKALQDTDLTVRGAAVVALAEWPSEEVMADLATLAQSAEDEAWRASAFEGYVRLIRGNTARETPATVELYRNALPLATGAAQLRTLFAGLAEVPDLQAAELVKPYLENAEVSEEARIAYDRIRRSLVTATASHNPDNAVKALDNDPRSRWDTGVFQAPGQWFQVDLTAPASIKRVVLDATASAADFPQAYEVYIGNDAANLGTPIVIGQGTEGVTTIDIPNVEGRFIRIVQTGTSTGKFWSIHELLVETN